MERVDAVEVEEDRLDLWLSGEGGRPGVRRRRGEEGGVTRGFDQTVSTLFSAISAALRIDES